MQEGKGALALTISSKIIAPTAMLYKVLVVTSPPPLLIGTTKTALTTKRTAKRRVKALKAIYFF